MGKKKQRPTYTSKGERRPIVAGVRPRHTEPGDRYVNKLNAYLAGKPVKITVPNPNPRETNRPFIRISGRDYWGPLDRMTRLPTISINEPV